MKDLITSKSFRRLLCLVGVLVVLLIIGGLTENNLIASIVNGITLPMSEVSAAVTKEAAKPDYDELYKENEELKAELSELRTQLADYYNVKQENERLWRYYDLKAENPQYDILPATVVRRDPNDDFYSFTLDKGKTNDVAVGDPVVTENGIIGWIYEVDAYTAKVKTILSPDAKVGVIDTVTRDSGVVSGNVLYADKNLTTMTRISALNKLKEGDIVTTTGISGIYPSGLIVGEVKEIAFDEYDTSMYAVISPFEDIRTVIDVVVITSFEGQGEISQSGIEDITLATEATTVPVTEAETTEALTEEGIW
ncbi:MAG: rod shape-determining protein MreC [Clostridia bacterium]|nr:rod shape-determining protein MreC [Clostridia bacterium]